VRQPIYKGSIGRWRAYEHSLGPLIEALGMDLADKSRGAPLATVGGRRGTSAASSSTAATAGTGPSSVANLLATGRELHEAGRLADAEVWYRQALAIEPNNADALNLLGSVVCNLGLRLNEQGKINEARSLLEEALKLAPTRAITYRILGYVKEFSASDPHLAAMERLARDMKDLSPEERIDLHFALAKAYEDIGDRQRLFQHLLEGNALKRKEIAYNEAATLALFDRIRAVFTPALLDNKRGCGDDSPVPVFIIGMPRSGKTTVERILAGHPQFHGGGEHDGFKRAAMSLDLSGVRASFPELVPHLSGRHLSQLGTAYLDAIRAVAPRAERISNTIPGNARFIGLMHLALPNARIIYVRRDPMEVCLSCFATLFKAGAHIYSYDLAELGRYYRALEALMTHWRRVLPEGVVLEVKLDELVADAEHKTRELVAHCGLEWNEACLATASAIELRRPVYRGSIAHAAADVNALRPLVEALGGDVAGTTGSALSNGSVAGGASAERAETPDSPILPHSLFESRGWQDAASKSEILIEVVKAVTIHNGLLRVDCAAVGSNNEELPSGALLIPGNQRGRILRALTHAVQELDRRLRERVQQEAAGKTAH
jgi:tetratricopeptide (TPR) repeat protein